MQSFSALARSIVVAAVVIGSGHAAFAAPHSVRLGLGQDAATTMHFAWSTYSGPADAVVEYGTTSGQLNQTVTGQVNFVSNTLGEVSEATATGLQPDTTYYYRVGGPNGGWSQEASFRTAPAADPYCGQIRFAYGGDSRQETWQGNQGASDKWPSMIGKVLAENPLFFLHGGDIVHEGTKQEQWKNHMDASWNASKFLPLMYSIGNHDDGPGEGEGANFNKIFNLPRSETALGGSGTEDYYAFRTGQVLSVSLSTVGFTGGAYKFKNQADWLDALLTQSDARWVIVFMHHPVYTDDLFINHPPNEQDQNRAFVEVFNKHGVDIVVGSHNHFYERWTKSKCANPASDTVCPDPNGTVYITSGGMGAFPIFIPGLTGPVRLAASGEHHYLLFDADNSTLTLNVKNEAGAVIDQLVLTKQAPSPDPCAAPPADAGVPPADAGVATPDTGTTPDTSVLTPDVGGPTPDTGGNGTPDSGPTPPSTPGCAIADSQSVPLSLLLLLAAVLIRRRRS